MIVKYLGFAAALGATAVWAGNFVVARALAEQMPPVQVNFWRWVVAFFVILPFGIANLRSDLKVARKYFGYLSIMALLGVTLMNSFIYKAGETTESLNMALIMPATPLVIMILARIIYSDQINLIRTIGIIMATTGIIILISRGDFSRIIDMQFQIGDIWTLGCMICFALYSLFMRQRPELISPVGFNIIVFGLGILYCLPFLALELWLLPRPGLNWQLVIGICYAGIGCSAIAFWLWTVAIDRIGPVRSGIIYYLLPFFAAIMAKIVLNESIYPAQIWGGCLIIGGILFATLPIRAIFPRK